MAEASTRAQHTIRLPSFLVENPVGLGDAIKRVTSSVGVRPCGACAERAAKLDRWLAFEPPPSSRRPESLGD
jgi:hypothetical protein